MLEKVFQRIRDAGLKLSPKKCHFFQKKIKCLGHVVSEQGISCNPKKTSAVSSWPTPTNVKDVQKFLGFTGFYRRFIQDYAKVARPLTELLRGCNPRQSKRKKITYTDWTAGWSSGRRLSWTGASTYWATSALLSRLQPPVHSEDRRQQTGSRRSTLSGAALRRCQGRGVWELYIAWSWGELQHSQNGVPGTVLGGDETVPSLPVWGSYFCCHHRP